MMMMMIGKGLAVNSIVRQFMYVFVSLAFMLTSTSEYMWSLKKDQNDQNDSSMSIDFMYQNISKNGQDNSGKCSSTIQIIVSF